MYTFTYQDARNAKLSHVICTFITIITIAKILFELCKRNNAI